LKYLWLLFEKSKQHFTGNRMVLLSMSNFISPQCHMLLNAGLLFTG